MATMLGFAGLSMALATVATGAAAQSRTPLTYVQEKNPYREVLLSSDRKLFPALEVGDSGTIFTFDDQSAAIFGVFQDNPLIVERIDNKISVTTIVRDSDGRPIDELVRNEWRVTPPPGTLDRNYSDDALEIRGAGGKIVLQLRVLSDRIQLQGEWWSDNVHGVRWVKSDDAAMPGAQIMYFGPNFPARPPEIQPIFEYPSDTHLGELKK